MKQVYVQLQFNKEEANLLDSVRGSVPRSTWVKFKVIELAKNESKEKDIAAI